MAGYKVEICGVNTATLPLLDNSEKETLFHRIKNGDQQARELYITGNLRLVLSVIGRFSSSGENIDDLFQIGCIGLMKAIDNFDLSHQVKFSTYAVPMIIGEVRRFLRDNNSIRVSRSLRDIAYKTVSAREALTRELDREPTLMRLLSALASAVRKLFSRLMQFKVLSVFMSLFTVTAVTRSTSWIKSVIRKIKRITGFRRLHFVRH